MRRSAPSKLSPRGHHLDGAGTPPHKQRMATRIHSSSITGCGCIIIPV